VALRDVATTPSSGQPDAATRSSTVSSPATVVTGPTATTTPTVSSAPGSTSSNACTWQTRRTATGWVISVGDAPAGRVATAEAPPPVRTTDVLLPPPGPPLLRDGASPSASSSGSPCFGAPLPGPPCRGRTETTFVSSPYTAAATADTSSGGSGPGAPTSATRPTSSFLAASRIRRPRSASCAGPSPVRPSS